MYEDVDFHALSEEEQRRLINKKQVATTSRLLRDIQDSEIAVRIFEKPLEEFVLDRLGAGWYTIGQLADEFSVADTDVRRIVNKYRRWGRDGLTDEMYKVNLLTERNGVIRVKHVEGRNFEYTLETIPNFARFADPTLMISLLDIESKLEKYPRLTEDIPAGAATEIDETYALLLGDFWDYDPQAIFDELTEYDRYFVETNLIPFPVLDAPDEYQRVRDRFIQPDAVYQRFKDPGNTVRKITDGLLEWFSRGQPGARLYQAVSVELADLRRAAEIQSPALLSAIDDYITQAVDTLDPENIEVDQLQERSDETNVGTSLEDLVLSSLDSQWETSEQVFESLPTTVRSEVSVHDIEQELQYLSGMGIISKRDDGDTIQYNSESGSVIKEDVL